MFVLMKERVTQCNNVAHFDFLRLFWKQRSSAAQRNTTYFM